MMNDIFGESIDEIASYAINRPYKEKIQLAIDTIRGYEELALSYRPEGFYVAFSGGKDSIVMAKLFEVAGVKYDLHYSCVTLDPPELIRFIRKYYPQAKWEFNKYGKSIPLRMVDKGIVPTRLIRWCCAEYKECNSEGITCIGVRAMESARRKAGWRTFNISKIARPMLSPIIYWTDEDIWQFIHDNNMPYCSLYDKGFKRLGCIGCPMANQEKEFERYPKYENLWRYGFKKMWEKYRGKKNKLGDDHFTSRHTSPEALFNWWIQDKTEVVDDCQLTMW